MPVIKSRSTDLKPNQLRLSSDMHNTRSSASVARHMATQGWQDSRLGGLGKHAGAVGALIIDDLARKHAVDIGAGQVDVDGRNLRQHLPRLPAVALRVLDLQLPPP